MKFALPHTRKPLLLPSNGQRMNQRTRRESCVQKALFLTHLVYRFQIGCSVASCPSRCKRHRSPSQSSERPQTRGGHRFPSSMQRCTTPPARGPERKWKSGKKKIEVVPSSWRRPQFFFSFDRFWGFNKETQQQIHNHVDKETQQQVHNHVVGKEKDSKDSLR